MVFHLSSVFVSAPGIFINYLGFNNMKKNLSIFLFVISLTAFSEVTYEEAVIENLQDIGSNVSDISVNSQQIYDDLNDALYNEESQIDEDGTEQIYRRSIAYYLWNISSNSDINTFEILPEIYNYLFDYFPYFGDSFQDLRNMFQENNDYWQRYSTASSIEDSKNSLQSIESHMDNLKISVNQLGDKIDQIIVNAGDSSDLLTDIIEQLQMLNDKTGGSESDFPVESVGYYQLENYGKNVSINHLSLKELETTGEYNKDVHRMLLNLNRLGSSQNNAALSILTNVQVIATALSQDAEGQNKLEKDLEDKEYQATKAESELSGITSQNWDSSFTPPRYLQMFTVVSQLVYLILGYLPK